MLHVMSQQGILLETPSLSKYHEILAACLSLSKLSGNPIMKSKLSWNPGRMFVVTIQTKLECVKKPFWQKQYGSNRSKLVKHSVSGPKRKFDFNTKQKIQQSGRFVTVQTKFECVKKPLRNPAGFKLSHNLMTRDIAVVAEIFDADSFYIIF